MLEFWEQIYTSFWERKHESKEMMIPIPKVGIRGNQSKPIKNDIDKSENSIIEIEENFSEETFLIGAKKAFEIIVSSYKENNIDVADQLLNSKVLNVFSRTNTNS